MVKKSSKRRNVASVDFEGVEAGGIAVPDGNYRAYPQSVELTEAESSGNEMFKFKWKILGPKCKGAVVWDNMVLVPNALWRLKGLMETMGMEVPDGAMEIDPSDLEGEEHEVMLEITNEKYKGKDQPRITGFSESSGEDAEEESEEEEEEEEEKPKKSDKKLGKKKKVAKEDEEEEEESEEEEEESEEEEEEEEKPKKKTAKIKVGAKVRFEDEKGKTVKGTITEIDGSTAKVEDSKGDEWELDTSDLEVV